MVVAEKVIEGRHASPNPAMLLGVADAAHPRRCPGVCTLAPRADCLAAGGLWQGITRATCGRVASKKIVHQFTQAHATQSTIKKCTTAARTTKNLKTTQK
jgi:hypothetical protein